MSSRKRHDPSTYPTGNGRGSGTGNSYGTGTSQRGGSVTPDTSVDPRSNWHENYFTSGNDRPGYNSLWENWIQNLVSGVVHGRSINEILAGMGLGGMMTGAKDSYMQWIVEQLLKNAQTQEIRDYDKRVLDEQRIYDNPTSQLARIMGSGISRDAAIAMMSGGSGTGSSSASPLIGSGTQSALASTVDPNEVLNAQLNKANTIMNAFATVASFAKMGVSLRQMSAQTAGQELSNQLTEKQIQGINDANTVANTFSNLVADGTITAETVKGFKNAQDILDYALDHQEAKGFKPLFDDGTWQRLSGSVHGRNALNSLWSDLLDNRSTGTQLDQKLDAMDNQLTLQNMTKIDFVNKINQGVLMNQHLQNQLQQDLIDLLNGALQLEINGEILSQEKINTLLAEFEYNQAETENRIFDAVYNTEDENGHTGVYYASLQELNDLYKYAVVSSAERSAMTQQWIDNYERSFFESGRGIMLSLMLQNAYKEGSLDLFTTTNFDPRGGNPLQSEYTTNAAGDAVILVNQTPLLQGVRLVTSDDFQQNAGDVRKSAAGRAVRRAIKKAVTKH